MLRRPVLWEAIVVRALCTAFGAVNKDMNVPYLNALWQLIEPICVLFRLREGNKLPGRQLIKD